jgi:hypothetical protein
MLTIASRPLAACFAFALAIALGWPAPPSMAMPTGAAPMAATSDIVAIAGGCGAGMHRGPYGGCRRNFANPAAHACPRGFHIGPGGRCRGNRR